MREIRWTKLWKDFNAWHDAVDVKCKACGHETGFASWSKQKVKIEQLVKSELSRLTPKPKV
jgi:hypothetical protein